MSEPRRPDDGPYRRSAREEEGPVRRGVHGFVTWMGALGILAVLGAVAYSVARPRWDTAAVQALDDDLAPLLGEPEIAALAHDFDPRDLAMPEPDTLTVGEQTPWPAQIAITSDAHLDEDALGVLIEARTHAVHRATLDPRTFGLGRVLARCADDVRWVGVVRSRMEREAYTYGPVRVDVERVEVAIVSLDTHALVARLTIRAAPPASTSVPASRYEVVADRVGEAIAEALSDHR